MARKNNNKQDAEGLLSRWSKRKSAARTPKAEELVATSQPVEAPPAAKPEEDPALKANREAAESIDIETLTYESDFSPFLKAGVPAMLRRRALRTLWSSHPVLANLDGLNDYDTDLNLPKTDVYKSAWKVGRGYLDHLARQKRQDDADPAVVPPETGDLSGDTPADAVDATIADHVPVQVPASIENRAEEAGSGQSRVSLRRRLMG